MAEERSWKLGAVVERGLAGAQEPLLEMQQYGEKRENANGLSSIWDWKVWVKRGPAA
jgi:hypothetical protein